MMTFARLFFALAASAVFSFGEELPADSAAALIAGDSSFTDGAGPAPSDSFNAEEKLIAGDSSPDSVAASASVADTSLIRGAGSTARAADSSQAQVRNDSGSVKLGSASAVSAATAVSVKSPAPDESWRDIDFDYRSEDPGSDSLQKFSPLRLAAVASLTAGAFGAAYGLVFAKGWWDEEGSHFHFENDFEYAHNLDKAGHFFAGVLLSEGFYQGYYWAGASEFQSYLFAGLSAMLTHVAIDTKDGYSPEWGFSICDVLSGTTGGFFPMAQRYVPGFNYINVKWSYWKNSDAYYRQSDTDVFTDDYVNETFWVSLKIYKMLPKAARAYWPAWLAVAGGWSIDDGVFTEGVGHGHSELYIALDYDWEGVFAPKERWARNLVRFVNYFKLPAPTVQVYPHAKFLIAYPIKF